MPRSVFFTKILTTILVSVALVLAHSPLATASDDINDLPPRWEYGGGLGVANFEHYPASSQMTTLIVPIPLFKYRGSVIRADDREGTRAHLLREDNWVLDFSGGAWPGKGLAEDDARKGMDELPWIIDLGPQLVYNFNSDLKLKAGIFQAASTDFSSSRLAGVVEEIKIQWTWGSKKGGSEANPEYRTNSQLAFSVTFADRQFLSNYFDVGRKDVRSDRAFYEAVGGALEYDESYIQTWAFRDWRVIAVVDLANYDISANRSSPLHKSDHNLSGLLAVGYIFGQSKERSVPEKDSQGVINVIEERLEK